MSRAKIITMMCILATSLAVSVACPGQAPKVVAQKLHDQLDQSWANHDLNQVRGFTDSSYVSTDERGKRQAFAEFFKEWQQEFPKYRNINPSTTAVDVQRDGDRMVVNYKREWRYEWQDQREGWVPFMYKSTGETTWERKGGQWKLVRDTVFRAHSEVDPKWLKEREAWNETVIDIARRAGKVR